MDSWGLETRVQQAFRKAGLTKVEPVLRLPTTDLMSLTRLPKHIVTHAKRQISRSHLTHDLVIFSALRDGPWATQWLTTGLTALDRLLGGGIPTQGIVEVVGESGTGKTQVCLQVSLPMLKTGAVAYVCTEDAFPSKRLMQLLNGDTARLSDNMYVEHAADVESLMFCLTNRLPALKKLRPDLQLVVVDSVAAVFRAEYESDCVTQRSNSLKAVSSSLRNLGTAVVCINQISASNPSLGLVWSNLITTRLILTRTSQTINDSSVRNLQVDFSPYLPNKSEQFIIESTGLTFL